MEEPAENILLLSCCAPCSCAVIEEMAREGRRFSVLFYNPNIRPENEYNRRRDENLKVCARYEIPFIELEYDSDRWQALTLGLEQEPEGGRRCDVCFHMRLRRAMEYAAADGFTGVASVLGVSRYKNLKQVDEAAAKASKETGVPYIHVEGRKNGMQELRRLIIGEMELYSQDYCGCKPGASARKGGGAE